VAKTYIWLAGASGYFGVATRARRLASAPATTPIAYDNLVHGMEWLSVWPRWSKATFSAKSGLRSGIGANLRLRSPPPRPPPPVGAAFCALLRRGVGCEILESPIAYSVRNRALLDSMRVTRWTDRILVGSGSAYGLPQSLPHMETNSPNRGQPYEGEQADGGA